MFSNLTDTNNVLSMYDVSEVPNGVTAQKTGNTLNLYSSVPITSAGVIKLSKKSFKAETAVTVWSDQTISGYQQIGTYKEPETDRFEYLSEDNSTVCNDDG